MLKVVFKSKYICTFFIVAILLMAVSCFAAVTFGETLHNYAEDVLSRPLLDEQDTSNPYITYYLKHHSGKYTLKGSDGNWFVVDNDGKVLYQTDATKALLANQENYLWETSEEGITTIVNIKTGEVNWTGKSDERVYTDNAGYYVIEVSLDNKEFFAEKEYYLLNGNFEVALNGLTFKSINNEISHGSLENYIYGALKETEDACVINSQGEIVYQKADARVDFVLDDIAWVCFDEDQETYHISLAGETKGQLVEVEWDE